MTSTMVTQRDNTADPSQPGLAIPAEGGNPTSIVVNNSAPVTETGAPAVGEPANKAQEDTTATTDLATSSAPLDAKSELEPVEPSTETPDASNKHKSEEDSDGILGPSWKKYISIRTQARALDSLNDEGHRDTIVNGLGVVEALLGYLNSLEQRMSKIGKGTADNEKDAETTDEKTGDNQKEPGPSLSYYFFHADNEFDANGQLVENNDRFLAHSNNKEPNTLIRATYSWTDGVASNPPKLAIEESPRPEQINLVTLAIYSTPISKFFEKELGFDAINHDIVRIGTPFRPLLRNLQAIRNHTEVLQKTFK